MCLILFYYDSADWFQYKNLTVKITGPLTHYQQKYYIRITTIRQVIKWYNPEWFLDRWFKSNHGYRVDVSIHKEMHTFSWKHKMNQSTLIVLE